MSETKRSKKSDSRLKETSISHSKILQEAKEKARDVRDLLPAFERAIKKLPENIRQDNDNVFDEWYALLTTVDTYSLWEEERKCVLNLRLQNAPGNNGIFQF